MRKENMKRVEAVLRSLGLLGCFVCMRQMSLAVVLAHENGTLLTNVTKGLYPAVAEQCNGTNGKAVERNLRSARDTIWMQSGPERICAMLGVSVLLKPTTGELVDMICYYMECNGLFCD